MKKVSMMGSVLLIFLGIILITTSCSKQPNCDDGNECTQDSFDEETKSCKNIAIDNCCGNNICEIGDDLKCPEDCPVKGISGFSVVVPSETKIAPDGHLHIKVKNIGQNPVTITDYSMPNFMQNLNHFTLMPGETSEKAYTVGPLGNVGDSFYVRFGIHYVDLIGSGSGVSEGSFSGTIPEETVEYDEFV